MPRPNKPWWHKGNQRWACTIGGKDVYFPKEIGQFEPPMMAGVPKRAWDWLNEHKRALAAGGS